MWQRKDGNPKIQRSDKTMIVAGLIAMSMGIFPVLIGLGVVPTRPGDAPGWIGLLAGAMFILAGAAVIVRGAFQGGGEAERDLPAAAPGWLRTTYYLLGMATAVTLAAIGSWVAFGPGERNFAEAIPFLGNGLINETIGRAAFGLGACLVWLFVIVLAINGVRLILDRRKT